MMQKQPCRANLHERANHSFKKNDKSVSSQNGFSSPARRHPKVMASVGGLEDSHRENRLMAMLPKSVRRCAASVMMARLRAAYPPADRARRQTAGLYFCWNKKRAQRIVRFFFLLTNQLSSHEDQAQGAGDAELPPGPSPHITLRPWRGDSLPAEPVRPPRVARIRDPFAQLRSRIGARLLGRTAPGKQNSWFCCHGIRNTTEFQTYHPRGWWWLSISCCFSDSSMAPVKPL